MSHDLTDRLHRALTNLLTHVARGQLFLPRAMPAAEDFARTILCTLDTDFDASLCHALSRWLRAVRVKHIEHFGPAVAASLFLSQQGLKNDA